MSTSIGPSRILFEIFGFALILYGAYLFFRGWSHINMRTRTYSYISEQERNKRSFGAGIATAVLVFGISFMFIARSSDQITFRTLISALELGACLSPVGALVAFFRMRRDLWTYTKTKDDIVSLENKKK
jgi:threonine/homoserine/homoserine lactone efflux protein